MFEFDLIHTLAFGGVALLLGYGLCRHVPILGRYNLPAPVVGGLLVAVAVLIAHGQGVTLFRFDTTLQTPLMIAFFTTIGFAASLSMLRVGGPQVLRFFLLATVFGILQNVIGILVALPFGLDPLFGVLAGSVTLTGGPATGLAFAPLFEEAGVTGAASSISPTPSSLRCSSTFSRDALSRPAGLLANWLTGRLARRGRLFLWPVGQLAG